MSKTLLVFALILLAAAFAILLPGGKAGPGPAQGMRRDFTVMPPEQPHYQSKGEPSALYGYVTVNDPATRLHYIGDPNASTFATFTGQMSLETYIKFSPVDGKQKEYFLKFYPGYTAYRGPRQNPGNIPSALWYYIPLVMVANTTSMGPYQFPLYNESEKKVYYDPGKWHFAWIGVASIKWPETDKFGETNPIRPVQLLPQPVPIADLPDFRGNPAGPR